MAQLVRGGACCASSLERVIADLDLRPLALDEEAELRSKLGEIIGRGLNKIEVTNKLIINPEGKLQTKNILGELRTIARDLQSHEAVWSIQDPANVLGARDLLGQTSFGTTEKYYIMGQSRLAGRVLARAVDAARKGPSVS